MYGKKNLIKASCDGQDHCYCQEEMRSNVESTTRRGSAMEVLTRVELDLAYSSEKLLNLDILLMEVAGKGTEFDSLALGNDDISSTSVIKVFEFDILSRILNSEVKELDNFMTYLQMEIVDACQKVTDDDHIEESSSKIEEKLHDAEISLKQSQDLVADIRKQSAKIEEFLDSGWSKSWSNGDGGVQNGYFSSNNTKWTLQNADQRRHVLQMLEKSLARELDLEKKLSDSRSAEEELKLKLCHAEQEAYCLEESMHMIAGRLFETEIVADVLLAILKELTGILDFAQCNPSVLVHQISEMQPELGDSMINLSAEESALEKLKTSCAALDNIIAWQENGLKDSLAESANERILVALRHKVLALEERLRESNIRLQLEKASTEASQEQQNMLHSELSALENVIEVLKENVLKTEGRAERTEAKCTWLTKANMELNDELDVLRNSGSDRASLLERRLKESDTQIEHAKASVDAIAEQQNILSATMTDMEHAIEDFKEKISKSESRALSAETKCTLLTETNFELNEELGFLRNRVDCLETSLRECDDAKVSTAKDIGTRSNVISNLVMKLALEREHLHIQIRDCCWSIVTSVVNLEFAAKIFALKKQNKILAEKCKRTEVAGATTSQKGSGSRDDFGSVKSSKEAFEESSSSNFQEDQSSEATQHIGERDMGTTITGVDSLHAYSNLETVRTIKATELNSNYLLTSILVLFMAILVFYVYKQ